MTLTATFPCLQFSVEAFENPGLHHFYSLIESIALEREDMETEDDYTLPNYERLGKKLGDLPGLLKMHCGFSEAAAASKRKAPQQSAKFAKVPKPAAAVAVDIDQYVRTKTVHKLKVDELKTYLTSVGERVYGKKKDQLVETVYDVFNLMK